MNIFSISFILSAFLIFVRVAAVVGTAPYFSNASFPLRIKLFFALALSVMMYPVIPASGTVLTGDMHSLQVIVLIIKEFLVGAAMGLTGELIFAGIRMGGDLMSVNVGLSFASTVDPVNQGQSSIVSQLFGFLAILVFVNTGGDAYYLRAMAESFSIIPIGGGDLSLAAPVFIKLATYLFVVGVQMASPFIIVLFLMDMSFAIFARIMPQANIFFIALPLKLGVGLILLLLILPYGPPAFKHFFGQLWMYLESILRALV